MHLRYGYLNAYRNNSDDVMIRPAALDDVPAIRAIAIDTEMFDTDGATFVDDVVAGILDSTLSDHHFVVAEGPDGTVIGAAYYAPEPFSDRLWNLYFLAVRPGEQGRSIGATLVDHVERHLQLAGPDMAQVLIVETSSTDQYARTREFYPKQGFVEEARIRRFYGPDDDKVVYWKPLIG
jgi:ribosomal protein S18 acetylase RimI-like enzyme